MKIKFAFLLPAVMGLLSTYAQTIGGDNGVGQWGPVIPLPLVPVAISNLPDGKILMWSADHTHTFMDNMSADVPTKTVIFDPVTATYETIVDQPHHNMFCPGICNLSDGRIMVTGGISYANSSIYDPKTKKWTHAEDMNYGRGYQGSVTLSNGAAFVIGGSWSGGITNTKPAEIWTPKSGWCTLPNIPVASTIMDGVGSENEGLYREDNHAWLWPAPNGKLFHAGPSSKMHWLDPTPGAVNPVPGTGGISRGSDTYSMEGTTVMFDKGEIMKMGGSTSYSKKTPANKKCFTMNINQYAVQVQSQEDMDFARIMQNTVMLADGRIFVVGGIATATPFSDVGAVLKPEIWTPINYARFSTAYPFERWNINQLPDMAQARTYHSVALLLQDGRVLVGGGGLCSAPCINHDNVEIYSPNYLFTSTGAAAVRPQIINVPETTPNSSHISVTTSSLGSYGYFTLVRMSSVTHSTNNDQRFLKPTFRQISGNSYSVYIENANILTPGYYMLFAINSTGVPSIAKTIRIGEDGTVCAIKPKITIDGVSSAARPSMGVAAGKQVVLSMYPEGSSFTITKVGGATTNGDLNLGAATVAQTGTYVFTTTPNGGCSTTLNLKVTDCNAPANVIQATYTKYKDNDTSPYVWNNVPQQPTELRTVELSPLYNMIITMTPTPTAQTGDAVIKLPTGQEVLNSYSIKQTSDISAGVYSITGPNGCSASLNVVIPCIIPEYKIDNVWNSGPSGTTITVEAGKAITLSILPNMFSYSITSPKGLVIKGEDMGDLTLSNLQATNSGRYRVATTSCTADLYINVVPKICPPSSIIPQYNLNNTWYAGTQNMTLNVATGSNLVLSMLPDNIPLTSIKYPDGTLHPDNSTITVSDAYKGLFTFNSSDGCTTTLRLNPNICSETALIPEYNINGVWYSGRNDQLTIANGAPLYVSMLPNGIGVTIQKPDGTTVGDNAFIGNMTPAQNGVYTFTSSQGCQTSVDIKVPCNIIPEYNLNNIWYTGKRDLDLTVDAGKALILSVLPNVPLEITKPNGTTVSGDYSIAKVTAADKGAYAFKSSEGCTTSINLKLKECDPSRIVPQFNLNNTWFIGKQNMNLVVSTGSSLLLSMQPDGVGVTIKKPNGTTIGDNQPINAANYATAADNGIYTFTSSEGCTTTLSLTVADCPASMLAPRYRLNGTWYTTTQNANLSVPTNSALVLSMSPTTYPNYMIFNPTGFSVLNDYNLGNVTPAQAGKYYIVSDQGCLTSLNLAVTRSEFNETEVNSIEEQPGLIVYPNPFSNELHVQLPKSHTFHSVSVIDALGRTISTKQITEWSFTWDLDQALLIDGVYVLKFEGKDSSSIIKLNHSKN